MTDSSKIMERAKTRISKTLSYALRHGIIKLNLQMDSEGYVELNSVLNHPDLVALNSVTESQIQEIVNSDNKQRYTLKTVNDIFYIRANQGHSKDVGDKIDDDLHLVKITKPLEICVHGTNKKALDVIMQQGLSPMARKHIHFAKGNNGESGVISGMRQDSSVKIYIDMARAMADGIEFFESDNGVILCPTQINPSYFSKIEK